MSAGTAVMTVEQAVRAGRNALPMPEGMHHEVEQVLAAEVTTLLSEVRALTVENELLRRERATFATLAGVDLPDMAVAS